MTDGADICRGIVGRGFARFVDANSFANNDNDKCSGQVRRWAAQSEGDRQSWDSSPCAGTAGTKLRALTVGVTVAAIADVAFLGLIDHLCRGDNVQPRTFCSQGFHFDAISLDLYFE